MIVTENALFTPDDPVLSSVVDVWSNHKKVFSARWRPIQPWIPPTVVSCKRGEWIDTFGFPGES